VFLSIVLIYLSWNFSSVLFALRVVLSHNLLKRAFQTRFLFVSAVCN
jgi:hypothetical protein